MKQLFSQRYKGRSWKKLQSIRRLIHFKCIKWKVCENLTIELFKQTVECFLDNKNFISFKAIAKWKFVFYSKVSKFKENALIDSINCFRLTFLQKIRFINVLLICYWISWPQTSFLISLHFAFGYKLFNFPLILKIKVFPRPLPNSI